VSPVLLFDSHLHLTDEAFADDLAETLARARAAGVCELVTVASSLADARAALRLARSEAGMWCSAGVHPHEASAWDAGARAELEELLGEPAVVAVGEVGLDYHYDHAPRAVQRQAFAEQLELAASAAMPVIVHTRDADADTRRFIDEFRGRVRGVLHCFTGGRELLEAALEAGWFISFSGLVTFRKFAGVEEVRAVPETRILIETDSPYLAPVPRRGRRNEPSFLPHTCEALAALRGVGAEAMAASSRANARALYGLTEERS